MDSFSSSWKIQEQFIIPWDASDVGLGDVLLQDEGDHEGVIAYLSQKLTSAQRKYQTISGHLLKKRNSS